MSRIPRFTSRTGLTGLGLVLLAAALVGGLVYLFVLGKPADGRGARAAERPHPRPVESEPASDAGRAAPAVEFLPAGTTLAPAPVAAPVAEIEDPAPAVEALALDEGASDGIVVPAAPVEGKVDGPELKYVREGKTEMVNGRERRRERRTDRREAEAEAAALGQPTEKRAIESPKKNASRSQVKKVGAQEERPARRAKPTPPPGNEPDDARSGG